MATFLLICIYMVLSFGRVFPESEPKDVANVQVTTATITPLGPTVNSTNASNIIVTPTKGPNTKNILQGFLPDNSGPLLRAFYVILSVTAIVVAYFVVRAVRLRRRKSKLRKYGIVGSKSDVEMTPLDQGDDDEDTTIFEASNRIRK